MLAQEDVQPTPPPKAVPVDPKLQPDAGRDWYQHGKNLYDAAKLNPDIDARLVGYANAIDVFTRYLNEYGGNENADAAWWYLGQSYYGSGRIEDAKRCFHNLLNRFGKGLYASAAAYTLAADHFNNRQYALAAPLFEKQAQIATKPEDRQRGNYYAGVCYDLQGRGDNAADFFQKVLTDPEPGNAFRTKAQFSLGRILARGNKPEEALKLLDQVVTSQSAQDVRGEAAVLAGVIAAKLGKTEDSDRYFMLVLNTPGMEASRVDAQLSLMKARYDRKRYKEVVDLFRQSDMKATGDKEADRLMMAAKSYMNLGSSVEALELFRQVERMALPDDTLAFEASYFRLVCFFKIQGGHLPEQVDAFLEIYKKSHSKDPRIHTALLMKAEALLSDKKTVEAAKAYSEIDVSLIDESNRAIVFYNRAYCQSESGDAQGAIRSASAFIEGYPGDEKVPRALIIRAKALTDSGEPAKAIVDYDRLIARKDEPALRADAWMLSAELSKQQGNIDDMMARYRGFLEKADKPTEEQKAKANYWVAWGLVKKEKPQDALAFAEAARKLDAKRYGKNAGQLLCICLGALRQPERLGEELDLAIRDGYASDLPEQLTLWAAFQAYNAGRFQQAARFYALTADEEDPKSTMKDNWRFYGKSLLEAGEPKKALVAINYALEEEDSQALRADGLFDRGRAQHEIGDDAAAMKTIDEGLALHPQGRVGFGLNILLGDIYIKKGDRASALAAYAAPAENMDPSDRVGKPAVLHKIIKALEDTKDSEMSGRQETLERYRKMMEQFPDWKPEPEPEHKPENGKKDKAESGAKPEAAKK
ncbi:MAG: hypothetical protein JWO82_4053 [Akkermansiaceae bacterium]|nr:hypothetical protein [Akkermansiaceae bacterium]